MRFAVVTLTLGILVQFATTAEEVAPQKVDQVFSVYNKAGSPGRSLGVIREGDFVYRKAYGSANLELGVPLSPQSVFYMGSVSKQFTAAAVVLAAQQGLLSLDDDVRKYVPELPDYGHVITLRQMLHQTSGFRDFFTLIFLSGRDVSDFNSPDEILKVIVRQKGLNNIPGDEWIYSNTNYFLLGVVVERATKKSLAEFATQAGHQTTPPNPALPVSRRLFANEKDVYGILLMKEPRANVNLKRGRRLIQRLSSRKKHHVFQRKIASQQDSHCLGQWSITAQADRKESRRPDPRGMGRHRFWVESS